MYERKIIIQIQIKNLEFSYPELYKTEKLVLSPFTLTFTKYVPDLKSLIC